LALNKHTDLAADTQGVSSLRCDAVSHANILSGSVALLCLGQSDFEAINRFREGTYFTELPMLPATRRPWRKRPSSFYVAVVRTSRKP